MKKYVAGFLYSYGHELLLINKLKPEWQKGKLNAIGGKIEQNETPHEAMIREFREETSVVIETWTPTIELSGDDWIVYFFRDIVSSSILHTYKNTTNEICEVIDLTKPLPKNIIWNLNWLIPLCGGEYDFPIAIKEHITGGK